MLAAALAAPLVLVFAAGGSMPQDPGYHLFADSRPLLGIANFANVGSNIPFLLIAFAGLHALGRGRVAGARASWAVFFLGVGLVTFGSGYYHASPEDGRLVWDRLPMTLAFMGLLVALVSEHANVRVERTLLAPAVAVGLLSVAWWQYSGDLRLYYWVQLAPLLAIVVVLLAYPGRYSHRGCLLYGLAFYALAKAAEFADADILDLTGRIMSGHTLKHLLAAFAPFFVYLMLLRRQPLAQPGGKPRWN